MLKTLWHLTKTVQGDQEAIPHNFLFMLCYLSQIIYKERKQAKLLKILIEILCCFVMCLKIARLEAAHAYVRHEASSTHSFRQSSLSRQVTA